MDSKKKSGPVETQQPTPKGKDQKGQKGEEGKGGAEAVKFSCLEMDECDPSIVEIPENEVNVATRQKNLANALGVSDWERKNWAKECPTIIDTGCNGCGLRSYAWLRRYDEYLRGFCHKSNLVKTEEKELRFGFSNHQRRATDDGTVLPIWGGNGSFKPVRIRLITGEAELLLLPGVNIVVKLDIAVCFGSDRFQVGHGGM